GAGLFTNAGPPYEALPPREGRHPRWLSLDLTVTPQGVTALLDGRPFQTVSAGRLRRDGAALFGPLVVPVARPPGPAGGRGRPASRGAPSGRGCAAAPPGGARQADAP